MTTAADAIAEVPSKLALVTRAMAAVSTVVYVCGLLVFHLYLGRLGIVDFDIVAGRYFALGMLFLVYMLGPLLVVTSGVTASRRQGSLASKVFVGIAASTSTCACLMAVWQATIAQESLEVVPRRFSWMIPYMASYGHDAPVGLTAISLIALLITVYLPVIYIWRTRAEVLRSTARLPITLSILMLGILLSARIFGDSVAHIPAAFGGGYYGKFIVVATADAQAAFGHSVAAANELEGELPVLLLHADANAIYLRVNYFIKERGAGEATFAPVVRIAQDKVVVMMRIQRRK